MCVGALVLPSSNRRRRPSKDSWGSPLGPVDRHGYAPRRYYCKHSVPLPGSDYGDRVCLDNLLDTHIVDTVRVRRAGASMHARARGAPAQARAHRGDSRGVGCLNVLRRARRAAPPPGLCAGPCRLATPPSQTHTHTHTHTHTPPPIPQCKRKPKFLKLLPLDTPADMVPPSSTRVRALTIVHYDGLELPTTIGVTGARALAERPY